MNNPQITVICVTRHGHGTTSIALENFLHEQRVPVRFVIADIGSPTPVARQLATLADRQRAVEYLRFEPFVSRQQARMAAVERVTTEYTMLLDNNILLNPGGLACLLETARETNAALVTPVIVTQGGSIHFSGSRAAYQRRLKNWYRSRPEVTQHLLCPVRTPLRRAKLRAIDIDYVESHCALAVTSQLRQPGVLEETMHNAHTMFYAGCYLRRQYGARVYFQPKAVASIVPMGCGYDLEWMLGEYLRRDRLGMAYGKLRELIGPCEATDLDVNLEWHAKHFKYLAYDMVAGGRLGQSSLLAPGAVPEMLRGYDQPLDESNEAAVHRELREHVASELPDLSEHLESWLQARHLDG